MSKTRTAILLLLLLLGIKGYGQEEPIIVTGSELIGRVENGMSVREVNGNVVLHQGNVVITCDRAIQYLAANYAHLIGHVIVKQDTLTIRTSEGFYYGNQRRAFSDRNVTLDDRKVVLNAVIGEYFFKESKADFRQNVSLKDSASTLYADRLLYFRREDKAIATSNVKIVDAENIIMADSLIHFRGDESTYGFGNIYLRNIKDNTSLFGQHLIDLRRKQYSLIDSAPMMVQIDTTFAAKDTLSNAQTAGSDSVLSVDTLVIKSLKMEAWRDSSNRFVATDSVSILRGSFASKNDLSIYERGQERIKTYKLSDSAAQPILWYELTQLTGDSILIFLRNREIETAEIIHNALIISRNKLFADRFDQVTGERVKMRFSKSKLAQSEIFGNVLSIYFMYDDDEPNGLIKASSKDARIAFLNNRVEEVHLFGEPKSEFHPENIVKGKEKQFTLPQFILHSGMPSKQSIFSKFSNSRFKMQ